MSKSAILVVSMFCSSVSIAQNITITFTGTGAANKIDSVTATNLTTNQSVTLPGNGTLILTPKTGIPSTPRLSDLGMVFPNPFSGKATFSMTICKPQTIYLKVQNIVGQVVAQSRTWVQPGKNDFELSVSAAGTYLVTLTTEQGSAGYKVMCTDASQSDNNILLLGSVADNFRSRINLPQSGLKGSLTGYMLGYTLGEVIQYVCISGDLTTILTDSPTSTVNYEVELIDNADPDGKTYSVVKIGDQTWMAENLAWLPAVSPPKDGSNTTPFYYVQGYVGTNVNQAKATANYSDYGVLYNWVAASTACPSGWHLPSDAEWTALTDYLGTSAGGKMKETGSAHWNAPNAGATNASGFSALPGGYRGFYFVDGVFHDLGIYAWFWTATEYNAVTAWWLNISGSQGSIMRDWWDKKYGKSVRCLMDQH